MQCAFFHGVVRPQNHGAKDYELPGNAASPVKSERSATAAIEHDSREATLDPVPLLYFCARYASRDLHSMRFSPFTLPKGKKEFFRKEE